MGLFKCDLQNCLQIKEAKESVKAFASVMAKYWCIGILCPLNRIFDVALVADFLQQILIGIVVNKFTKLDHFSHACFIVAHSLRYITFVNFICGCMFNSALYYHVFTFSIIRFAVLVAKFLVFLKQTQPQFSTNQRIQQALREMKNIESTLKGQISTVEMSSVTTRGQKKYNCFFLFCIVLSATITANKHSPTHPLTHTVHITSTHQQCWFW